jgi:hypothetical protein
MNYKSKYHDQKHQAAKRGIDFKLTYEEWINWWGDDVVKRGNNADDLCMCRYNDVGSYELGNIYKDTRKNNSSEGVKNYTRTLEHSANLSKALKGRKAPNKGIAHTEEVKAKMSEARKGKGSRQVRTPLGIFNSRNEAAKAHNIDPSTLYDRIKMKDGYEYI